MTNQQWYFWGLVVIPFHCGKSGRMHSSSLLKFRMFETEGACMNDAEMQLSREKPDKFAEKRESLRIIIKKTEDMGKEYLATSSHYKST
jgi:hypothetical protein